jgi:AcrR family transcriptional regulator
MGRSAVVRARRVGSETSATRTVVLDVAEKLMLEEGYAAVTTRGVAAKAGLKSPLVHYYFPTTDDLLLALYLLVAERTHKRTMMAVTSEHPLEGLWNLGNDPSHTALAIEMAALANHHLMVRRETAKDNERYRSLQTEALSKALQGRLDDEPFAPVVALILIQGISRLLVIEEALGATAGHNETRAFIEWLLQRVQRDAARGTRRRPRTPRSRRPRLT